MSGAVAMAHQIEVVLVERVSSIEVGGGIEGPIIAARAIPFRLYTSVPTRLAARAAAAGRTLHAPLAVSDPCFIVTFARGDDGTAFLRPIALPESTFDRRLTAGRGRVAVSLADLGQRDGEHAHFVGWWDDPAIARPEGALIDGRLHPWAADPDPLFASAPETVESDAGTEAGVDNPLCPACHRETIPAAFVRCQNRPEEVCLSCHADCDCDLMLCGGCKQRTPDEYFTFCERLQEVVCFSCHDACECRTDY